MKHLKEHNISYFAHAARAFKISGQLLYASFAAAVHGICPFLFETTASYICTKIVKITEPE